MSQGNDYYNEEAGRKLADRFREHLVDAHKATAKPVSLYFNSLATKMKRTSLSLSYNPVWLTKSLVRV